MKQWISLLLALVLSLALALPAGAAPPEQEEAAAWGIEVLPLESGAAFRFTLQLSHKQEPQKLESR